MEIPENMQAVEPLKKHDCVDKQPRMFIDPYGGQLYMQFASEVPLYGLIVACGGVAPYI